MVYSYEFLLLQLLNGMIQYLGIEVFGKKNNK